MGELPVSSLNSVNDNSCQENLDPSVNGVNGNNGFKFSLPLTTTNLRFESQDDLGKLFAQGNGLAFENATSTTPLTTEQVEQQPPFFRKIARPIPPSLNTNFTQLLMQQNNNNNSNNNNIINYAPSPSQADSPEDMSGHRRRDSNVSAMSIQLYDVVGSGHQRRDSNVSNMSMQLDTPTPSSGTESGNEDENKLAFFPFTFSQKSLSRPGTPTTPPPYTPNFYSASTTRSLISHHPQRMRRLSLDLNVDSNGDLRIEKPSPMHRAVRARRASLLPKTKSFQRIVNELQEELQPIEAEIKQEYKTTKVLKNECDNYMDTGKLPEDILNNWIKFRDIQPSPPPYAASKLNPEIDLSYRQDTPSPTSSVGPWPISGRIKRKASEDRFEPYFNPKRRAVSPSLVGSPPIVSSVPSPPTVASSPSFSGSNGNGSTRGQVKGNSNLVNMQDANGSFSRMNLNGE